MNTKLTLVEATVYDNITEANGRQEVLNALREQAQDLAALRSQLEHRFVTCTWCGWRLDYEADGREAAHATVNKHALHCNADPRNVQLATVTAERDAYKRIIDGARAGNYDNANDSLAARKFIYKELEALKGGKG